MPTSIDETELARLEALAAGATTFPWKGDGHKECGYGWVKIPGFNTTGTERSARLGQYLGADDDARYIAAACNAVPALVAEVRRLQAQYSLSESMLKVTLRGAEQTIDGLKHRNTALREKVEAWEWWDEVDHLYDNAVWSFELRQCAIDELYATLTYAREAVHADRE